jgi:hypothetical protein
MDGLRPPCINDTDAKPNLSAFADGTCSWGPASKWNKAVAPLRSVVQVCIYICIPMRFIHSQFCQDGLRTNTQREERSRFLSAGRNRFSY